MLLHGLLAVTGTTVAHAEDCGYAGRSYLQAARAIQAEARPLIAEATDRVVRGDDGARELFRKAEERQKEAQRLKIRGYKERSECMKRLRAAKQAKRIKKREHSRFWRDVARGEGPLAKIKINPWAMNSLREGFESLRSTKQNYKEQLATVSSMALDLRTSVRLSSPSLLTGSNVSTVSMTLSVTELKNQATKAISQFKQSMDSFKRIRLKYESEGFSDSATKVDVTTLRARLEAILGTDPRPKLKRPSTSRREQRTSAQDDEPATHNWCHVEWTGPSAGKCIRGQPRGCKCLPGS